MTNVFVIGKVGAAAACCGCGWLAAAAAAAAAAAGAAADAAGPIPLPFCAAHARQSCATPPAPTRSFPPPLQGDKPMISLPKGKGIRQTILQEQAKFYGKTQA